VEKVGFDPAAVWENVEINRLDQLMEIDRKILRWNRSFMDVTNPLGQFTVIALVAPVGYVGAN
jgi:hypothetical protein